MNETTDILAAWRRGDPEALDLLIPLVQEDLRLLASRYWRRQRPGVTYQTTALVDEVWVRYLGPNPPTPRDRREFFALAATIMLGLLCDRERKHRRLKHGAELERVPLTTGTPSGTKETEVVDFLALEQALLALAAEQPEAAEALRLNYLLGMTFKEIGEVLGFSTPTAHRRVKKAKLWLRLFLGDHE